MIGRGTRWRRRPRAARALQPRWPDRMRQQLADLRRGGRRARAIRRGLAAALFIAAGVVAVLPAGPGPGVPVLTLATDLPIGTRLSAANLQVARTDRPPDGAIGDPAAAVGRTLAGSARRGEIVTDLRLSDQVGPAPGPGRVAVPITPQDPAAAGLLGPGMHVAVVQVADDGTPRVLAADAVVLLVAAAPTHGSVERPVVLAVPEESADSIVAASVAGTLALRFA